jgi:hypothetical protein
MTHDHTIARYRRLYRQLLRFYPRPYGDRFAESMEQTFNDLCRERASAGQSLFGFALWTFSETAAGILRENVKVNFMQNKNILRIAIAAACILIIPLLGNTFVDGWNWGPFDFVFAFAILFGTGVTFELVARKCGATAYRAAVAIACVAGFLLVWVNAAVGIIGDEELANAMYLIVLAVGFVGAFLARFEPRGMSRALFATAAAQLVVPIIALAWVPEERFTPGILPVMYLNAGWVAMWLASALLFRHAANGRSEIRDDEQATRATGGIAK